MEIAKRLAGIGEYYFSSKLREIDELNKAGAQVINLGIGSPDLPPHPSVIKTLWEVAQKPDVHGYQSYKGSPVLRKAFADWYKNWYGVKLDPDTEILPLMGSKEGIMHICMTYLNEGDAALVPNPGYPTYRSNVKIAGGHCIDYPLKQENDFQPDLEALAKMDLSKVKLFFVNYPQMPTGQLAQKGLFEELVAFARERGILIVHDNPYSFILNDQPESLLHVEGAKDVAIELNSLSKSHNMAGWRIGVLCGSAKRIGEVLTFKSNMDSGMFLATQLAAATALGLGKEWYDEVNRIYRKRQLKVFELLETLGCSFSTTQAGLFVWAGIPGKYRECYEMADEVLQQARVFITPGGIFGDEGNQFIRISLCGSLEKFDEAIKRIKENMSRA